MRRDSRRFAGLLPSRSGAAAVEFALLAPLLIMFLAVTFEAGRAWLYYDRFVTLVDNTSRWAARFPEFETRVRLGVGTLVIKTAQPLDSGSLDLTLRSAKLVGGTPVLEFEPYSFFGNAEDLAWSQVLADENFAANEAAIIISARYRYKFLFSVLGNRTMEFKYVVAVNPFYSRTYKYQSGFSDFNYWNVKK